MYDSIAEKIKGLAKFLGIACIACGIIVAIIGAFKYGADKDCIQYATVNGGAYGYESVEAAGNSAYIGLQMVKYGLTVAVVGIVTSWPMYGFGELIENSATIARNSQYILEKLEKKD